MTLYPEIHVKKHPTEPDTWLVITDCQCPDGLVIPAGFSTDFASVPRYLWWLIPPHGAASNASIRHDHRFVNCVGNGGTTDFRARYLTDLIYYHDLIEQNVPGWQSWAMYQAVRYFGMAVWMKHREAILKKKYSPMLEIRNSAGLTLQLAPDSRLNIEILSTILNTDDVLRGSYSYPFRFPLSPANIRFLGVGYSPEQVSNVELDVSMAVDGMPVERGLMSYKTAGRWADAYLKLHLGEVASRLREMRLRDAVSEQFTLGGVLIQWLSKISELNAADPGTYPVVFPPFRNDLMVEPDFTTGREGYVRPTVFNRYQPGFATLFYDTSVSHIPQFGERELVPMLYLTWVIRKVFTRLGYTAVGSWLQQPDVERLILFNTQTIPALDEATGGTFSLSPHLPDMSVGDFLKALRSFQGLGIFFDSRYRQVRFVDYRTIRTDNQYQDFTEGFVPDTDQPEQPASQGYKIKNYIEDTDDLYKEVDTFRPYNTVGNGETAIDLQAGTLFMTRENNPDSFTNAAWLIPHCKQPGNLGDPIFSKSRNYSAYGSEVETKNRFGLRLLSYFGMQPDHSGLLYPYASSLSYNYNYDTVGTLSLMPGEPDDVFARYQQAYYEMLAQSRKIQVDLLLTINQAAAFRPYLPVGLKLRNRIFSKWLPSRLSYELPSKNSQVLARLEAVQLVPVSLKPTIPQELLYQAVWVFIQLENETVDDGLNYLITYADVVVYFYERGNKTNPIDMPSLPISFRQYRKLTQPDGSLITETEDLTVTASGLSFPLLSQVMVRRDEAYYDPNNPQEDSTQTVEQYVFKLLPGTGYRIIL